MIDFRDSAAVEAWVRDHEQSHGNGRAALQRAVSMGIISGPSGQLAREWLDEQNHGPQRRAQAEDRELQRRATIAAETSARAAVEAAAHAADSARWARWAVLVAAAALIVSAWPFIKVLGMAAVKVGS